MTGNDATRLTAAQIEDWRRHLLGYFPATAASELHELCDLALRSLVPSAGGPSMPLCDEHRSGELERPDLTGGCAACRIAYLEAQESLLEEWQQRAKSAEEAAAEIQRPLDAQMARLNETVTRLNVENERLRSNQSANREYKPCVCTRKNECLLANKCLDYAPASTRVVQPSSGTLGCDGRWQDCPLEPCRTAMKCGCNKFADMDVVAEVIALLRDIESNAAVGEPDWGGIEQRIKATLSTLIRIKRQPGYMGDINGPGCDPDVP